MTSFKVLASARNPQLEDPTRTSRILRESFFNILSKSLIDVLEQDVDPIYHERKTGETSWI